MNILAIDPGPTSSAYVVWDGKRVRCAGHQSNEEMVNLCVIRRRVADDLLAIECIQSFGMAVGQEVHDTSFWAGRFVQAWGGIDFERVFRKDVKMHLCGSMRAKDANIRQAILDRFGGKDNAIGRKASRGPLYGVSGHCWSALAVALTAFDKMGVTNGQD